MNLLQSLYSFVLPVVIMVFVDDRLGEFYLLCLVVDSEEDEVDDVFDGSREYLRIVLLEDFRLSFECVQEVR